MNLRCFTLHDLIVRNARLYGDRIAFIDDRQRITHAEFAQRSERLATGLAKMGLGRGDRIAVLAGNSIAYVDLFAAAARLGAMLVPINVRLSPEEVAHILADVSPRILVAAPDLRALLPASLTGIRCLSMEGDGADWPALQSVYAGDQSDDLSSPDTPPIIDTDGLVIIHTAAVGGKARGAVLTHRGLLSASASALLSWRLQPDDVNMGALPLYHVAGLGLMLAAQHAGAASVIMPRFDADALVRSIDQERGSIVATFAPMLGSLIDAAAKSGSALASLRGYRVPIRAPAST
jgi:acyl-CoA synthetase (AMP-forming)/AMP-acid ligase II